MISTTQRPVCFRFAFITDDHGGQRKGYGQFILERNVRLLNPDLDFKRYNASGKGLASRASLADDGRISASFTLKQALPDLPKDYAKEVNVFAADKVNYRSPPRMNIVIMIVGSRGEHHYLHGCC